MHQWKTTLRTILTSLFFFFTLEAKTVDSMSDAALPCQIKLDPETAAFLKEFDQMSQPGPIKVENMRQAIFPSYQSKASIQGVRDLSIPGPFGSIPARLYFPKGNGPYPVYISFEGGGWIAGSLDSNDNLSREICHRSGCLVVSVEYRKAPEYPFPKPLEDCYAAAVWIAQHIAEFNGDPQKLAIGGDSAGGNLAAAVTLLARDRRGPSFRCQVLIYPATNYDFDTLSYYENAQGYFLTRDAMKQFWAFYLKGANGKDPRASPLQADLGRLPPALILVAHFDPLRDDGLAYAHQLKTFDVPTVVYTYPTIHGFVSFANRLSLGRKGINDIAQYLQQQLRS
ncbi:alpha/beta hydrolase [Candidatus Protochlamydia phocaeensis]|uniref:alpha/beta hydrolase n=1 Tax=Candidatus Protochlamydia phocaeensis TaxID=1414722 RepID=UPI00083834A8|nr:alpha/beta hydrolase [Candidatus Protochlamydia phocaeensis]